MLWGVDEVDKGQRKSKPTSKKHTAMKERAKYLYLQSQKGVFDREKKTKKSPPPPYFVFQVLKLPKWTRKVK